MGIELKGKTMKTIFLCLILLFVASCAQPVHIKPDPIHGEHFLEVPRGTKIGDHTTQFHGGFISEQLFRLIIGEMVQKKDMPEESIVGIVYER